MASIYLDHNATTPVRSEVFDVMEPFFKDRFGNASSIHRYGQDARAAVEEARARVAGLVNARPGEIYFTSGGTESDNLAIKGTAYARKAFGRHIITTNIEHSAVLNSCAFLEREGFEVTYLPVDEFGRVDPGQVEDALTDRTILVSIMHANNEIGTVQPVGEIGRIARARGVCFHTDAVQSAGKLPVDVEAMGADLLSLSGHKIYGPKGVGAIYIRKGVEIEPTAHGGHHENDVRSGTENTVGIVGMGKSAELAAEERESEYRHLSGMRDALETRIRVEIEGVRVNGHPERRLPGTLNVSFPGAEGESLIMSLDIAGIAVSTGSACTSGAIEPSHVLLALGRDPRTALGSVRFSFGRDNSMEDVDCVMDRLPGIVARLREVSAAQVPG
ncbi:MAG: cysteine desulfurase NifS [Gemmatimonadetes bacterium]|nr:cysteine desulfurase NifS [Gemmatimonadota bacterium]MYH19921.1 cysteine desulfurase NifS [Gemmatimonadota bacterium]MYK99553.1 cysteine desulfurase NifS [Gemmatimonadota bacterium]